ncbi:MAG TPA: hypothetical protein VMG34_04545 [Bacteroidota bacterium]|nr:hypothetical protein [Bacteroidota bacterium]
MTKRTPLPILVLALVLLLFGRFSLHGEEKPSAEGAVDGIWKGKLLFKTHTDSLLFNLNETRGKVTGEAILLNSEFVVPVKGTVVGRWSKGAFSGSAKFRDKKCVVSFRLTWRVKGEHATGMCVETSTCTDERSRATLSLLHQPGAAMLSGGSPTAKELSDLASAGFEYRQKLARAGGGGGSYEGFQLPASASSGTPRATIVEASRDTLIIQKGEVEAVVDAFGKVVLAVNLGTQSSPSEGTAKHLSLPAGEVRRLIREESIFAKSKEVNLKSVTVAESMTEGDELNTKVTLVFTCTDSGVWQNEGPGDPIPTYVTVRQGENTLATVAVFAKQKDGKWHLKEFVH